MGQREGNASFPQRVPPCPTPGRAKAVPTVAESSLPHETAVAQRWWSLALGTNLLMTNGRTCQLVFAGRPGGSAGPDVRNAVLIFGQGEHQVGDIEFHVRASDWVAHNHSIDPRYNNVMLHVVLLCDDLHPTTRQDGYSIPTCSLYDIPIAFIPNRDDRGTELWPCHTVMRNLSVAEQEKLLHRAGLLRFEQKTHAFVEELHKIEGRGYTSMNANMSMDANGRPQGIAPTILDGCNTVPCIVGAIPCGRPLVCSSDVYPCGRPLVCSSDVYPCDHTSSSPSPVYNACLIPALAEGLAYGRDRAFFRAAGQRLLGQDTQIPEPLGRAPGPSPLDAKRLNVLRKLLAREPDVWSDLQRILTQFQEEEATTLKTLRDYFCAVGLSLARADILLCNVVLPFAAAIALLEHNTMLGELAQQLYEMHPGLSSNTVTRMMCTQLLLAEEPRRSCQQQGLHYIYQQTCQAKHCDACMMGRNIL